MQIFKYKKNFIKDFEKFLKKREYFFSSKLPKVKKIIDDVKNSGDKALIYYQKKLDKYNTKNNSLEIFDFERKKIEKKIDTRLKKSINLAFERVKKFHSKQYLKGYAFNDEFKNYLAYNLRPLERVGIYIPGGTASYPSSVIMNSVPAIVAGVKDIIMCTPAPNNIINPGVIYAARVCGIKKIFKVGGAQAVAAMAFGTKTIKKVDKIVGPGNIYVNSAKKEVFGSVGIDMIAGPSEITVIADNKNNSTLTALDLLSQAEHDVLSQSILVTTSNNFAEEVKTKVYKLLEVLPRKDIATQSIKNNGAIIICNNFNEVTDVVNLIAPEHLEIKVKEYNKILKNIRNAGSIFLGEYSPEAIGDYLAGPNHVLPTSGSARFSSGLSVYDFYKKISVVKMSKTGLEKIGRSAMELADYEGLFAHSQSIRVRIS